MTRSTVKPLVLGILAAVLLFLLARCEPGRDLEALLLLSDIAAGEKKSLLKALTPAPVRVPVSYRDREKEYNGDLYRPGRPPRAGLLLIPGAAEGGKDDPRLVAFAETLARGRFTVLVPDLAGLKSLRVGSGDVREVADSFEHLLSLPAAAPQGKAGMFALSYAAGPALLASLTPAIRDRVSFVMAVGGYHNLSSVLTFFTTGYFLEDGRWRHRTPNEYGKWVFILSNVGRLADPKDRELFRQMAERLLADLAAETGDLAARLGPEGRSLYAFAVNRDPSRVPRLIAQLPEAVRHEIAALDLADKDLSPLRARLILVHGLDDDIIPYTESVALARAVPKGQAELFLARGLFHVEVRAGLRDSWRLWRAVAALLRARDRAPGE